MAGPEPAEGPERNEAGRPPAGWPADLGALGPFFAVRAHDPGTPPAGAWRAMDELTAAGSAAARERVRAVRAALAAGGGRAPDAVELRVAASVTHLGLVARLLSPYAALAVLHGWVPARPTPADLYWRPVLGGPYPLSLPHGAEAGPAVVTEPGVVAGPAAVTGPAAAADPDADAGPCGGAAPLAPSGGMHDLAAPFAAAVLDGPVRALGAPFAAMGVSPHILRGNAASALHGAAGMLAAARPWAAARAREFTAALRSREPLAGTGERAPGGAFRRRSCCLIYRAAPGRAGALCGDCVLRRPAG